MKDKLRRLGDRWPWFGRALDVQDRVGEINGSFVASGITVSVFLSLFPLILVAIAIVGFVASNNDHLAADLIDSLGLTGSAAETMSSAISRAADSRQAASVLGLLGLAWSGSAVAVALQQAIRAPWQESVEGVKDRLQGIGWLVFAAVGFSAVMALSGLLNVLPDGVPTVAIVISIAAIAVGLAAEVGLFWFLFWTLGSRRVPRRDLLPGAVAAAVGFEALKLVGTLVVPRLVARSSALYGPIGIVFAILAWLALFARLIVYASTLNAVRFEDREGTVELPILVPRLPGRSPVRTTRSGTMVDPD